MSTTYQNEITSDFYVSESTLMSYAWPGGYPILYLDASNSTLCPECASKELQSDLPAFQPIAWFIHEEGPVIYCEDCNAPIESAYGDPEESDDEFDPENGDIATDWEYWKD